jgi:hypothetical protein
MISCAWAVALGRDPGDGQPDSVGHSLPDRGEHLGQLGLVLGACDRELLRLAGQPPHDVVGDQV